MPTGIGNEVLWLLPDYGETDQSPDGNDATYFGGMGVTSGKYVFDGTDDRMDVADDATLDFGTGPFTISFWLSDGSSGNREIIEKQDGSNFFQVFTKHSSVGLCFEGGPISGSRFRGRTTGVTSGHIVLIRRTTGVEIYVDNVSQSVTNDGLTAWTSDVSSTSVLNIGKGTGGHIGCKLEDLRMFDTDISAADVTTLYNGGVPGYDAGGSGIARQLVNGGLVNNGLVNGGLIG